MSLKDTYIKEIVPKLQKELKVENVMSVPAIERVIVNVGIGTFRAKFKDHTVVEESLTKITGQKPVLRLAKKAISNFNKLREGQPNGLSVTLRRERAYDFIEKLIKVVYPRVHDFRGVNPRSFDGHGNISLGFRDSAAFIEFDEEDFSKAFGLEVTVVTSANTDEEGLAMLTEMGFPFKK